MVQLAKTVQSITSDLFIKNLFNSISNLKKAQKDLLKSKNKTTALPLFFIGDQNTQTKKPIIQELISHLTKNNFTAVRIDPWLNSYHNEEGCIEKEIIRKASRLKSHKKQLRTRKIKHFIHNNIFRILTLCIIIAIVVYLWEVHHSSPKEFIKIFHRGGSILIIAGLLLRIFSRPLSSFLDKVFSYSQQASSFLTSKELRKFLTNNYQANETLIISIEHIGMAKPDTILSILNAASSLAKKGFLILISGNQNHINHHLKQARKDYNAPSGNEIRTFYLDHFSFNYYFHIQVYTPHPLYIPSDYHTAKSTPADFPDERDDAQSKAIIQKTAQNLITFYDVNFTQFTGVVKSILFYKRLLHITSKRDIQILTAFYIAYRYDRFFLIKYLSQCKTKTQSSSNETENDTHDERYNAFLKILNLNNDIALKLTWIASDLDFMSH